MENDLKPCPFCGLTLVHKTMRSPIEPYHVEYWQHEKSRCILSLFEVEPHEITKWNRRADDG